MNMLSIIMFLILISMYSLFWTIMVFIIVNFLKKFFFFVLKESVSEENSKLKIDSKQLKLDIEQKSKKEKIESAKIITTVKDENKKSKSKYELKSLKNTEKRKIVEKHSKINNKNYSFEYRNENEFRKLERTVKKFNMLAYKKLIFEYYDSLKNGKFLGKIVSTNNKEQTKTYALIIPTDEMFAKIHGDITLHYTVYEENNIVLLETITPEDILLEGHRTELPTYKGVMISKENKESDMFKINLLNMLRK